MKPRPNVLTIAGFDPSSGAGLSADIKTLESLKCYGLAVCTANTIQNDIEFKTCNWAEVEIIKNQIQILFDRFDIDFVKIGIIENWKVLNEIIDFLISRNENVKVVLDPILRSSSNFDFRNSNVSSSDLDFNRNGIENQFDEILNKIYLLTPNYQEIEQLYTDKTIVETIKHIISKTNLFLKGGHREEAKGKDELFTVTREHFKLNPKGKNSYEKHGSGCVLSSAIIANLALGFPLLKACYRGKRYTEKYLSSNKTLLGYHKM
ncbi:hydroxymethylpyrimidine/phosphomethylpyrimidine kinase [Aquimarina mytili]|uniref:hydroxymethylpyrimidine kinase n=1 Tax=Aquimarina mytili TaxID=874423 RepID=A0A937D498_9FLAO|nr:hydroxymethylpyrimidine/phosphomethylpyrimidine kinase [Aquimarina mytili]MBL0681954.1 hydroxymethylpyrimidine/phosphomethylpyrimidine kinase [Aquimarina mytili]